MVEAYPLQWPAGWPRTEYPEYSRFKSPTVASARDLVLYELDRLGATDAIISSNMELNRNGYPSARQRRMSDTGVAVYFKLKGEERCIPSDKYTTLEDNLHAIGLSIKALRSLDRWGTGQIMEAAFRGFTALPPGGDSINIGTRARTWQEVLGLESYASKEAIREQYLYLSKRHHPDVGGDTLKFQEIVRAYNDAMREAS